MSMTNVNPKLDSFLAFEIMINSHPGDVIAKTWLKEQIGRFLRTEEPYKLLTGSDYTTYMTRKEETRYKRGE